MMKFFIFSFLNDMRHIPKQFISKLNGMRSNNNNLGREEKNSKDFKNKENVENMGTNNQSGKTAREEVIGISLMVEEMSKPVILKTLTVEDLENLQDVLENCLESVKKVKERKIQNKSKKIQFTEVQVKEFSRAVDGGGTVPDDNGPTLGLDWNHVKVLRRRLSSFEQLRSNNRVDREQYMQKGYIPPIKRANILQKNGASTEVMNRNVMKNLEIKKNRKESVNCQQALHLSGLPVNPL